MEESVFLKTLGSSPVTKVLNFMLTYREFDYSKKEIAENAGVSYNTLNSIWSQLLTNEIVINTRRVGKQDMFRLNTANKFVVELMKFFDSVLRESIEDQLSNAKMTANNRQSGINALSTFPVVH